MTREPLPGRFKQFRDLHRGETILVCGCGASLNLLDHLERFVTIGVNDVGRRFTPDYLVVVNERRQFDPARFAHVERSEARAVFTQLDLGLAHPRVVRFRLGRRGGTDRPEDGTLHFSNNSPFVAVGLARHLGASRIGLIGVDFTDDHFFGATGRHPLAAQLARIDREYGGLAAACRAEGVELVNLSPFSRLASLPRARLTPAGDWVRVAAPDAPAVRSARPLTVAVENRPATGAVGQLLDALAASAHELGHHVVRSALRGARIPATLAIVWNGRALAGSGPTLFCEHGWLPRSDYQISPKGINADFMPPGSAGRASRSARRRARRSRRISRVSRPQATAATTATCRRLARWRRGCRTPSCWRRCRSRRTPTSCGTRRRIFAACRH